MKHSELIANITKRKGKEPTQQEIADILGLTRNAISSRAFRDAKYDYDEVEKIKQFYDLDFSEQEYLDNLKNDMIAKRMEFISKKDEIIVDYYPEVFGSCGSGTFVLSESKEKMPVARKLFSTYSPLKHYSIINAFGDSMNPYIHDKDKLLIQHWECEQIKDNRVYVFRYGEKIFCKRFVDNIKHIIAKSDNTMYEPIKIDCSEDDFQIIGQIVGLIRNMD